MRPRSIFLLLLLSVACRSREEPAPALADAATALPVVPAESSGGGSDIRPVYPVTDRAGDPLAEKLCGALHGLPQARRARCCKTPVQGDLSGECTRVLSAALADGAVALEAAAVDRCVATSSSALTGCEWVTPRLPLPQPACTSVIQGRRDAGAKCRSTLECKSGLFCQGVGPMQPGVCGPPSPDGARCGASVDTLLTYSANAGGDDPTHRECKGWCNRNQCAPFVAAKESCWALGSCGPGAACVKGKCRKGPPAAIGASCAEKECVAGAVCVNGACAALKKDGEECSSPFECVAACLRVAGKGPGRCGMQCDVYGSPAVPLRAD